MEQIKSKEEKIKFLKEINEKITKSLNLFTQKYIEDAKKCQILAESPINVLEYMVRNNIEKVTDILPKNNIAGCKENFITLMYAYEIFYQASGLKNMIDDYFETGADDEGYLDFAYGKAFEDKGLASTLRNEIKNLNGIQVCEQKIIGKNVFDAIMILQQTSFCKKQGIMTDYEDLFYHLKGVLLLGDEKQKEKAEKFIKKYGPVANNIEQLVKCQQILKTCTILDLFDDEKIVKFLPIAGEMVKAEEKGNMPEYRITEEYIWDVYGLLKN